ncbi:hypothetical protein CFAEC_14100 (plasmid) [Corynebacterium faecale]|nr:hypothetical protein CFAEC_14100 [Corynebacterium faecale]
MPAPTFLGIGLPYVGCDQPFPYVAWGCLPVRKLSRQVRVCVVESGYSCPLRVQVCLFCLGNARMGKSSGWGISHWVAIVISER